MSSLSRLSTFLRLKSCRHVSAATRNVFSLSGVYPAVVTPFRSGDEAIDFARYDVMLRHLDRFPVAGFALLASSGEFASVGTDKKLELVAHARRFLGKHRVVLAGAGVESTAETIELVQKMSDAGADACFVYNPSYFREVLDRNAYVEHFTKIADRSPIPVILYNIPTHTDVDLPIDAVVQLAKHTKIAGLLDTGGNITRIATICMKTSQLAEERTNPFSVVAGSASFFLSGLTVGCTGTICSLANVLPFEICELHELFQKTKMKEAMELQWRLLEPNEAVTTKYGVAGLKSALRIFLGIDTGSVRLPLRNLKLPEEEALIKMFGRNGFFTQESSST